MSQALHEFIQRYGLPAGPEGPLRLVTEVFGAIPDDWQSKVLVDLGNQARLISIQSSHGPGKTTVLSWAVWWFLLTRFPQKTACTAPTAPQMYDALFADVKMWGTKLSPMIRELYDIKSDRIELLLAREQSFATFRTARPEQPEALAGIHAPSVLLIADEASGVPEAIFEAALGSMSSQHATTIVAGNPVRTGGFFFNTHYGDGARRWNRYHIAGVAHELLGPDTYISTRVSPDFVQLVADEYGEGSNAFRVRVLGLPPKSEDDAIIPFEWIEAARGRDIQPNPNARVVWGVDVAGAGKDLTALAKRRENLLLEPIKTFPDITDTMVAVGALKAEWDLTPSHERPSELLVDAIGMGTPVVSRLRELGLPARGVNVAESSALNPTRYRNLRTELWFAGRDWFARRDSSFPPGDPRLEQELAAQKYKPLESSGKVLALPKGDMKKFLHPRRSPDRADAFILTFASTAATAAGIPGLTWQQPLKRRIKGIV